MAVSQDERQEVRDEVVLLTTAIMRLGGIGFHKIPLDMLKEAREALEECLDLVG